MCVNAAAPRGPLLLSRLLALTVGLGVLPTAAAQTTWYVPADQPTIQMALGVAVDGDTILVAPGLYREALFTLGKSVTLRGTMGAELTVVAHFSVDRCTSVNDELVLVSSQSSVTSSIFWGLPDPIQQCPCIGPGLQVTYSDVMGGHPGTGNIDAHPLFADPLAYDFALLPGSPAINTGDPALPPDPDGSVADMGAVPYHPWTDVGSSLAGTGAAPVAQGTAP